MKWSIEQILEVAYESLDRAHQLFREEYGVLPGDKKIDVEIEERYLQQTDSAEPPSHIVRLPAHLVLALMLREGWAGRGRGKRGGHYAIRRAVLTARKRKAELIAGGEKPGLAEKQAAEKAIAGLVKRGYRAITVERFRRMMQSDK